MWDARSVYAASDPRSHQTRALALRAAEWLLTAGQRANHRGDIGAALVSLEQAARLLPAEHPRLHEATLDLADVLRESDVTRAAGLYQQVVELANATGDERTAMHARVGALDLVIYEDPEKPLEAGQEVADHQAVHRRPGQQLRARAAIGGQHPSVDEVVQRGGQHPVGSHAAVVGPGRTGGALAISRDRERGAEQPRLGLGEAQVAGADRAQACPRGAGGVGNDLRLEYQGTRRLLVSITSNG